MFKNCPIWHYQKLFHSSYLTFFIDFHEYFLSKKNFIRTQCLVHLSWNTLWCLDPNSMRTEMAPTNTFILFCFSCYFLLSGLFAWSICCCNSRWIIFCLSQKPIFPFPNEFGPAAVGVSLQEKKGIREYVIKFISNQSNIFIFKRFYAKDFL